MTARRMHSVSTVALFLALALILFGALTRAQAPFAIGGFIGAPAVIIYFLTFTGIAGGSR